MADNKEKLVEQEKEKLAEERQKIDTFADFGNMYNFKKDFTYSYKTDAGLTEDIVREISEKKHEPEWMLNFRLNRWTSSTIWTILIGVRISANSIWITSSPTSARTLR